MNTTYNVRIYATDVYKGARTTTYWVRWKVAGEPFKEPFKTSGLAKSFKSNLVKAASEGEAFVVETGRPVSMARKTSNDMPWYQLACGYVDVKWAAASANYRRSIA